MYILEYDEISRLIKLRIWRGYGYGLNKYLTLVIAYSETVKWY